MIKIKYLAYSFLAAPFFLGQVMGIIPLPFCTKRNFSFQRDDGKFKGGWRVEGRAEMLTKVDDIMIPFSFSWISEV